MNMVEGISKALLWGLAAILSAAAVVARAQQVPCYFVFGDSVFDNGNNNNLTTKAKVNYSPYGIDFISGPTGRFSNGRNIPDVIAELLGFKEHIPPFAGVSSAQLQFGVNYASGGAGICDESSQHLGERISFSKQIENHRSAIREAKVNPWLLNQCLYTINIGSNDYMNNYFMPPPYSTSRRYSPDQYAKSLVELYSHHLKTLYDLGARKVALFGIGQIGCTPRMIASHGRDGNCAAEVNDAAKPFNERLRLLVLDLNMRLAEAKFTFIDMFNGANAAKTASAAIPGFEVINKSCCTVQPGQELCMPGGPVCSDRKKHIFWDNVHATEAVNMLAANVAFGGLNAFPYSIGQLAKLN